jgi:anti-sigma factor RsiW
MHQPILEGLEEYLTGKGKPETLTAFEAHLASCTDCRLLVAAMREQSGLIRHLAAGEDVEPAAGFYGRVMSMIEAQNPVSFWSLFLEPVFGRRLAFASLALFLVLASVMMTSNPAAPEVAVSAESPEAIFAVHDMEYPPATGEDVGRDRDLVLGRLASWDGDENPPIAVISE